MTAFLVGPFVLVAMAAGAGVTPTDVAWRPAPPVWVSPAAIPAAPAEGKESIQYLLMDDQVRVVDGVVEAFRRTARRVVTPAGLEGGVDVMVDWHPAWQDLTMNWVRVRRGDQVLEPVEPQHLRVLQREQELEWGVLHDQHTLAIFVPGLQVGDIVDVAFTKRGSNPALTGRYAGDYWLAWPGRTIVQRDLRVVWRGKRPLFVRLLGGAEAAVVSKTRWGEEHRWSVGGEPVPEREPWTPSWWTSGSAIQLSDFESWEDVATWALPGYQVPEVLPEPMQAWLTSAKEGDTEARFLAAAAFVRGEVRYVGFEVGENTLRPHAPAEVFQQRYGDCKDTALLLVTLLTHLGIEASAALVSTEYTTHVDTLQPSPFAFNHVIVKATVGQQVRWVDGTMSHEKGPYDAWEQVGPYQALVLAPGVRALESVVPSPPTAPDEEVSEQLHLRDGGGASLTVRTVLRRGPAAAMRHRLARAGSDEVSEDFLEFVQGRMAKAELRDPLQVDDRGTELELVESYRMPGMIEADFPTDGWAIMRVLRRPEVGPGRRAPLAVGEATWVRHTVEVSDPDGAREESDSAHVDGPGFRFDYTSRAGSNQAVFTYELWRTNDEVPAGEAAAYAQAVERVYDRLSWEWRTQRHHKTSDRTLALLSAVGGVMVLALLFLVPWYVGFSPRAMLRRRAFARRTTAQRGETPQEPLRVKQPEDVESALRRRKCACGIPARWGALSEVSEVRLGESVVWVQKADCEACGRPSHVYFTR